MSLPPGRLTYDHVDGPSRIARIFIPHKNIHATRVVTLLAKELGTISKNSFRGITSGARPYGLQTSHPSFLTIPKTFLGDIVVVKVDPPLP